MIKLGIYGAAGEVAGSCYVLTTDRASQPRMFLTHGEDVPRTALRDQLVARFGLQPTMPKYGEEVEL